MTYFTALLQQAQQFREKAYAPYSKFHVGASIRAANNQIFAGCNIENASYSLALCAEASAIGAMIAAGQHEIAEVLVISSGELIVAPCGACRQRLWEFAKPATLVHMCAAGGEHKTMTLEELLPFSFDAKNLDKL